jgi:hypothetical protein
LRRRLALAVLLGLATAPLSWRFGLAAAAAAEVEVIVRTRSPYSYDDASVVPITLNDRSGRYLSFRGRTLIVTPATPGRYVGGTPGRCRCDSDDGDRAGPGGEQGRHRFRERPHCELVGAIPPTWIPGEPERRSVQRYVYQLDCQDLTFNRLNDGNWLFRPGWMGVDRDPTAAAVAERYCAGLGRFGAGSAP